MWIALAIVVTIGAALYLHLAFTCFFTEVTFMTAYQTEYRASGSHVAGLRAAMNVFTGRTPFNMLADSDLDRALDVLSLIPDARSVAKIIRDLDRKRDASLLANGTFLSRLETQYRRMRDAGSG